MELLRLREVMRSQIAEQERRVERAKREQEIKTLLKQADAQMEAKRLTEPAGNNAVATYRQILKLDTGNTQAQVGLERIAQEYLQQARQRRSVGALQDCLGLIDKGLAVVPDQVELLRLREEVRAEWSAEQQRLEQQRQIEQQQKEQQRKEQQRLEQQRQSEQQQQEQQWKEQQRKLERQQQEQQRLEQQRQEEKQRDQQKKLEQQQRQQEQQRQEQQQRLEQQRKEQQRFEQQRQEEKQRQEQQRKLEQQRQENLPQKPTQPETTKPRVFGTF